MRFKTFFVLASALALPLAATAQTTDPATDPMEPMEPMPGQPTQEPTQPSPGTLGEGSDVRTSMPMGEPQVEVFKDKDNFEVEGTVSSVDSTQNRITLNREGLPPMELQVAQGTEITMDGQQSSLSALQAGSEVRARFNVAQDKPVAIELEAKQSKMEKRGMERMDR